MMPTNYSQTLTLYTYNVSYGTTFANTPSVLLGRVSNNAGIVNLAISTITSSREFESSVDKANTGVTAYSHLVKVGLVNNYQEIRSSWFAVDTIQFKWFTISSYSFNRTSQSELSRLHRRDRHPEHAAHGALHAQRARLHARHRRDLHSHPLHQRHQHHLRPRRPHRLHLARRRDEHQLYGPV